MELHLGWKILVGLFFFFQLGDAGNRTFDEEHILALQVKVENLVEKIINFIKDYYYQIKTEMKCLPDCVATKLMDVLKSSIDCVDENEKGFISGNIQTKAYRKNFLKCFSDAKKKIADTINENNDTLNDCPDEVTEKTYHINVTTSFTKTFHINIKNGVDITKKEIVLDRNTAHCFDEKSETRNLTSSTKTNSEVQKVHKEMAGEEKQKVNDAEDKEEKEAAKDKKKEKKHGEKAKEVQSTKKHSTKHDTETSDTNSEVLEVHKEMEAEENQEVNDAEENEKTEAEKEKQEEEKQEEEKEKVEEEETTEELTTHQADLLEETNLNKTETNRFKKYLTPKENLEDEGIYEIFDENLENGRKSFRELADEEEKELRKADLEHDSYLDYVETSDSIYI